MTTTTDRTPQIAAELSRITSEAWHAVPVGIEGPEGMQIVCSRNATHHIYRGRMSFPDIDLDDYTPERTIHRITVSKVRSDGQHADEIARRLLPGYRSRYMEASKTNRRYINAAERTAATVSRMYAAFGLPPVEKRRAWPSDTRTPISIQRPGIIITGAANEHDTQITMRINDEETALRIMQAIAQTIGQ